MIQRLQTLWLLFAATCMALTFKFKFSSGDTLQNNIATHKDVTAGSHIMSLVLVLAFLAIAIYSILIFKRRKAQMWLAFLNILIGIACIYSFYWQTNLITNTTYAIAALLPLFAIGFTISALHCIWQDHKKMKELNSNRLR